MTALRPLRPHQQSALDDLRRAIREGARRPVVQAVTGFGKTVLAAHIVAGARAKHKRVAFCVPTLGLVDQTFERFLENGIDAADMGVIQSDHPWRRPHAPIQIATAQTLARRSLPEVDVVVVDECHVQFGIYERWMKESPALFIGLSATPWAKGMGKKWDRLIKSTPMSDLIDMGYLSPFRVFAPSIPNLDGIATVAGDYHEGQLADRMNKPTLVADIVTTWIDRGEDRPTLCFATGRDHAKAIRDRFAEFGIPVAYVDANTPREEREEIGQKLGTGEIKVAVNIGCLTTGIDWDVRCIILARPTKSHSLFTQIIGRGLRTAEGKLDCIILDHSDTHARLGMVTDIDLDELDDGSRKQQEKARKREKSVPLPKCCPACTALMPVGNAACLECGTPLPRRIDVHTVEGDLSEFTGKRKGKKGSVTDQLRSLGEVEIYGQLESIRQERGRSPGWVSHSFRDIFGKYPPRNPPMPKEPVFMLRSWVRNKDIRWARGNTKAMGVRNAV